MRRLFWGGFPRFEQVGNPLFELSNLRPDFPDKAVCLLDISVQFAFLGGDTFLLHLASSHAHVDGGYLVYAALGVAAVVDTLRASVPLKKSLVKSAHALRHKRVLPLSFQPVRSTLCVLYLPLGKRIRSPFSSRSYSFFGLRCPCAALVKGAHGKHDMTMGVAAVGVMDSKIHAHSFGNKLRGTVFPDKPYLFLSG